LNVSLLFTRLGWKNEREAEKQMSARMSLCSEHSLTAASVPEYVGASNSTLSPGFTSISNTCQNKRRRMQSICDWGEATLLFRSSFPLPTLPCGTDYTLLFLLLC
jgi:hypothetical protein